LKNEPEKLLINHNFHQKRHKEQINFGNKEALDHFGHHQANLEYKKLCSEDQEHRQIIGIGGTDIYSEKMKIRIPDPTFDDNFHNEKSLNSVRVNSIHHKLKEEDEVLDENGQQKNSYENNKESEEEFKNITSYQRDQLIEANSDNNDHVDLPAMEEINDENVFNQHDNEKNEKDAVETNNYDEDMQGLVEENAEANGEQATPENGEANEENAAEKGENGEVNAKENKDINDNVDDDNNNGEEGNNAESLVEGAENQRANEENNAQVEDKPAENAEGEAQSLEGNKNQAKKAEIEANAEAINNKPEGDVQGERPENLPVESAENKEETPQE
jgi:hypothetical protein